MSPATTLREDEIRAPRQTVVAGIELPEEEMWRLWLRIKKYDITTPVERGRRLLAVLHLGDFVRHYGFRFTVFGEELEPLRYILVTQSKWFREGYLGMPEEQIPLYPGPGKIEERARNFLKKCSKCYVRCAVDPNLTFVSRGSRSSRTSLQDAPGRRRPIALLSVVRQILVMIFKLSCFLCCVSLAVNTFMYILIPIRISVPPVGIKYAHARCSFYTHSLAALQDGYATSDNDLPIPRR